MHNCPDSYHGLRESVSDRQKPSATSHPSHTATGDAAPDTRQPAKNSTLLILNALRRLGRRPRPANEPG